MMKMMETITDTNMVTRLSLATSSLVSTVDTTCPWISSGHIVSRIGSLIRLSVTHLIFPWSGTLCEKVWRYVLNGLAKLHEQDHIFSLRDRLFRKGFEEANVHTGKVVKRFPSSLKMLSIGIDSNEFWAILTKLLFCRYSSRSDNKAENSCPCISLTLLSSKCKVSRLVKPLNVWRLTLVTWN